MTADMLRRVGEALYGEQWQSALSRDLRVSDRTMRYWLAGRSPVPSGAVEELRSAVAQRRALLAEVAKLLAKA